MSTAKIAVPLIVPVWELVHPDGTVHSRFFDKQDAQIRMRSWNKVTVEIYPPVRIVKKLFAEVERHG